MSSKLLFTFIMLLFVTSVFAQTTERRYNAYSGTMVLSVEGGATIGNTDYSTLKSIIWDVECLSTFSRLLLKVHLV